MLFDCVTTMESIRRNAGCGTIGPTRCSLHILIMWLCMGIMIFMAPCNEWRLQVLRSLTTLLLLSLLLLLPEIAGVLLEMTDAHIECSFVMLLYCVYMVANSVLCTESRTKLLVSRTCRRTSIAARLNAVCKTLNDGHK